MSLLQQRSAPQAEKRQILDVYSLWIDFGIDASWSGRLLRGGCYAYCPFTSACNGYQDDGVLIAGASSKFWNDRGACGSYYRVSCTGSTNDFPNPCTGEEVTVKIVDYCPPPFCNGDINLSRDAFQKISQLKPGRIWVSYDRV
ncbi:hypothetical protein M5K25_006270 [Dendrobium thyrsiflorum]|uniref:Expansin-like EG45 domain-containing protein n=1 Tax=Dendrobium thyrsiflorum TaxID=117978 RepID=A0ABD0VIE5_DENTH